jgi:ApbE superfamily uncharacterized protein (UPF0280 family)
LISSSRPSGGSGHSEYVHRFYRDQLSDSDLLRFRVAVGESDLQIGVSRLQGIDDDEMSRVKDEVTGLLLQVRRGLRAYIERHPEFRTSLVPIDVEVNAPPVVRDMADAAEAAGVGPMAAVAGAIAHAVGSSLADRFPDVVVENGGDIFLASRVSRTIGVYAGTSSGLSDRLAIRLGADRFPLGVCTSAGMVGPSLSFGSADAVTILSKRASLADAAATAVGNRVKSLADVGSAVKFGASIPGVEAVLVVKGDKLGVWGNIELV